MAFGFLGSLANIPMLSKVSRALGTVIPGRCDPGGLQSLGDVNPDRRSWDRTGKVIVVSPQPPEDALEDFRANQDLSLLQLLQRVGDSSSMV